MMEQGMATINAKMLCLKVTLPKEDGVAEAQKLLH